MFMKRDPRTLGWLEAWYGQTPQFYGRLSYGNELKGALITEHCSELHPAGCQTTTREFNARSNIQKWWTGSLTGGSDGRSTRDTERTAPSTINNSRCTMHDAPSAVVRLRYTRCSPQLTREIAQSGKVVPWHTTT